jgi:hypothetical protein
MTRYTINIGDEFPLNDERPGASGRRLGFALRALFALSIAAIIFTHPFRAAILLGLALLVHRSNWFAEARLRWRRSAAMRQDAWRRHGGHARWNDRRDERGRDERGGDMGGERPDNHKAFV